eukprot:403354962
MKNLLNVFGQQKKEKSKTRFEDAFEKKLEKEIHPALTSKQFMTEPDRYDRPIVYPKSPAANELTDDQPVVKLLNPASMQHKNNLQISGSSINQLGQNALSVQEQARHRDRLIQEGAFRRLLQDKQMQESFEQRLDEMEKLQKTMNYALYEKDYEIFDKSKMHNKVIFDAVDHLQHSKSLQLELNKRKVEYSDYVKQNICQIRPQFTEENYNILYQEAANLKAQIQDLQQEIGENQAKVFQLEMLNQNNNKDINSLRDQLSISEQDRDKYMTMARSFKTKLTLARRQNSELTQMRSQEAYKYFMDCQQNLSVIDQLNSQLQSMKQFNQQLDQQNKKLQVSIDAIKIKKKLKLRKKREFQEQQIVLDSHLLRTLHFLIKDTNIMRTTAEYLNFKEYLQLGAINRKFYSQLRGSTGAKSCIHYIKIKVIDKQPSYTISYKYNQGGNNMGTSQLGGGGISSRFNNNNMLSPNMGSKNLEENENQMNNSYNSTRQHNYSIHSSNSMVSQGMDFHYGQNVSNMDLQKLSNNEKVQKCMQRYVNEDHRVALSCQAALFRASQLLIGYATIVYNESEIKELKKLHALDDLDEYSFEVPQQNQAEISDKVKSSIKSGIGSLMNMFSTKDQNTSNRPSVSKKNKDKGQTSLASSHIVTSQHMLQNMNSQYSIDSTSQPQTTQSMIEQQTQLMRQSGGFYLQFNQPEDVYKYLVRVGTVLVVEKDKITQLFKKIQQSYAELFYHSRVLYREAKDLEILKDFFKMRISYLMQKLQISEKEREELERKIKLESDQKKEYNKKANIMEKRCLEAQAELLSHRQKTYTFEDERKRLEKQIRDVSGEYQETRERLETENYTLRQMYEKIAGQRDVLKRAMQEYEKYLIGTITKQIN